MGLADPKWPQLAFSNWTLKVYCDPRAGLYTTWDTLPLKLGLVLLLTVALAPFDVLMTP